MHYTPNSEQLAEAMAALITTPEAVAAWLWMEAEGHAQALDTDRLAYGMDMSVPQLLAVAFGGNSGPAYAALDQLRARFAKAHKLDAHTNACEALRLADQAADRAEADFALMARAA